MVPALEVMREWSTDAWISIYRQSSQSVQSRPKSRQEALISNVLFLGYGTWTESVNTDLFILEDALESGIDVKGGKVHDSGAKNTVGYLRRCILEKLVLGVLYCVVGTNTRVFVPDVLPSMTDPFNIHLFFCFRARSLSPVSLNYTTKSHSLCALFSRVFLII